MGKVLLCFLFGGFVCFWFWLVVLLSWEVGMWIPVHCKQGLWVAFNCSVHRRISADASFHAHVSLLASFHLAFPRPKFTGFYQAWQLLLYSLSQALSPLGSGFLFSALATATPPSTSRLSSICWLIPSVDNLSVSLFITQSWYVLIIIQRGLWRERRKHV